jgi:anti-anti-sigma factor
MRPQFTVHVDHATDRTTIVVGGEIDIATIASLKDARAQAVKDGPASMRIDLRGVSFIDSAGLKFLLETHRMAEQSGLALSLVRPNESAMHAFRLTGTDLRLPFVDIVESPGGDSIGSSPGGRTPDP